LFRHNPHDFFKFVFYVVLVAQHIPHIFNMPTVLGLALYVAALLVFATPMPLLSLPFRLAYLYSWFMHLYLKKIYSPQFNGGNIRRYVKLDIYLQIKCFGRKTKYKITIVLVSAAVIIAVFLVSMFSSMSAIFAALIYAFSLVLGTWFGIIDATIYVDVIVKRRSCHDSARLSKELKRAIINLGLNSNPYRLFSDHKATIGFSTFIIIFLGFLWYATMFKAIDKSNPSTFEEILQKFIWQGNSMSVQEFLFMFVFYFFSFVFTIRYYTFILFTLKNLRKLRGRSKSSMNVIKRLRQKLYKDIYEDMTIPLASMFLRYMWTGKLLTLGGLNPNKFLYALMLISLLDLPMAPLAHYLKFLLKFLVESILRCLFKFILRILSALNLILLKIRQKLRNPLVRLYYKLRLDLCD